MPATQSDISDYYAAVRPQLRLTRVARRNVRFGFFPPMPFWVGWATPAKPAWATLMALSAAMLPRWARRLYGWPALPTTDLMATAHGRLLREVASRIPATAENPARAAAFARLSGDGVGSGPTIEDRLLGVQPANS